MAFDKVRFVITNNKILINKGNNKITELQTIYTDTFALRSSLGSNAESIIYV